MPCYTWALHNNSSRHQSGGRDAQSSTALHLARTLALPERGGFSTGICIRSMNRANSASRPRTCTIESTTESAGGCWCHLCFLLSFYKRCWCGMTSKPLDKGWGSTCLKSSYLVSDYLGGLLKKFFFSLVSDYFVTDVPFSFKSSYKLVSTKYCKNTINYCFIYLKHYEFHLVVLFCCTVLL